MKNHITENLNRYASDEAKLKCFIEEGFTVWARQSCKSKIFLDKPDHWFKVWFYIVSNVNWKDNGKFKRGEGYFTYDELVSVLKPKKSKRIIDRIMRWLRADGMQTTHKSTRGLVIKVNNYDKYQDVKNYVDDRRDKSRRQTDVTILETLKKKHKEKEIYKENFSSIEKLTPEVVSYIANYYHVKESFVEKQRQQLELYCQSNGKKYKDYKATLMMWVNRKLDEAPKTERLKDLEPKHIEDLRLHPERLYVYQNLGYDVSRISGVSRIGGLCK